MKRLFIAFFAVCITFPSFAYLPELSARLPNGYIESSQVRTEILSSWLFSDPTGVLAKKTEKHIENAIYSFSVNQRRLEKTNMLEVSVLHESRYGDQSSWYFYRKIDDGEIDSVVVYPIPDSQVRLIFKPYSRRKDESRSYLELHIYGMTVCTDVPVGLSLSALCIAPLSTIISLTAATVPWYLLSPEPFLYEDIVSAIQVTRARLPSLVYYEDGAFNDVGVPVHINDGSPQNPDVLIDFIPSTQDPELIEGGVNCSGFVKWIVDGMIRPFSGSNTYIEPLKESTESPQTHFTKPFRHSRDLFFALDWTRNLGAALVTLNLKKTILPHETGIDVSVEPFAGSRGYEKNVGYPVGEIIPYLYYLAAKEPGHMYLGALSRERGRPLLRQYHHAVALFPYFDAQGLFSLVIFESAIETPPAQFVTANLDAWIHLVRLKIPQAGFYQP